MIKQETIDLIYKAEGYSKRRKKLIKDIWREVTKKHFLKNPEGIEDVVKDMIGTIEIAIDLTKKFLISFIGISKVVLNSRMEIR